MLKIEREGAGFTEAIQGISTPKGRKQALKICTITGTGGVFRAELAARKGDIKTTAAFLAIDGSLEMPRFSRPDPRDPVEILSTAYWTKAQTLDARAERLKRRKPHRAVRLKTLASGYRRQSEAMDWHRR